MKGLLSFLLVWSFGAGAAEYQVLTESTSPRVLRQAAADAGTTPKNAVLLSPSIFEGSPPHLLAVNKVEKCPSEPKALADPGGQLKSIRGAINYGQFREALDLVELGRRGIVCSPEPVSPSFGSKLFYLQGVAHLGLGDEAKAIESLRSAVDYDRLLTWDVSFNPAGVPLLERARADRNQEGSAVLRIVRSPAPGVIRIDGKALPQDTTAARLGPGLHLVQLSEPAFSAWVELGDSGEGALVLPDASFSSLIGGVSDAEARTVLGLLLWATIGPDRRVIVPGDEGSWMTMTGDSEWFSLPVQKANEPSSLRPMDEKLKLAGGGTLLLTGTFAAISLGRASTYAEEANNATDGSAQQDSIHLFETWNRRWVTSAGITLAGAAALGASIILDREPKAVVTARWIPGDEPGACVAVTGSF